MNKLVVILLSLLLLAVVFVSILWRSSQSYYRDGQAVRLDPTNARHFVAQNKGLDARKPGETRIVYFGDSRIEQWNPLPMVPNVVSINRGNTGETTALGLLRLQRDVLALRPSIVVIQYGINDLKNIGLFPDRGQIIPANCLENLLQMITQLREHDIHVVVTTLISPGEVELLRKPTWSNETYRAVREINTELLQMKVKGVTVLDWNKVLAKGDKIAPEYGQGTLLLSAAGYAAIEKELLPVLRDLVQKSRAATTQPVR